MHVSLYIGGSGLYCILNSNINLYIYIYQWQKTNVIDAIILYYVWINTYRDNYKSKDMYVEEDELVQILNIILAGEYAYLL